MSSADSSSGRPYDNVVYQRMRHILMSYRNLWAGSASKKYDWGVLAADIEVFCDITFPKNSLENFVRGWMEDADGKKRSPSKRKAGTSGDARKFSIPQDDRIEAIIQFLTDKTSKGWFCDRDQLLQSPKFQAPFFLQEQLNQPESSERYLTPEHLIGHYQSQHEETEDDVGRGNHRCLRLHILETLGNGAVIVDLVKSYPYSSGDRTATIEPIRDASELYSGWAVLSREENLFLFTKHFRTGRNEFYLSLGIDNKIYLNRSPDALVLLAHDLPADYVSVANDDDGQILLDSVRENLFDKLVLLRRVCP